MSDEIWEHLKNKKFCTEYAGEQVDIVLLTEDVYRLLKKQCRELFNKEVPNILAGIPFEIIKIQDAEKRVAELKGKRVLLLNK